MSATGPTEDWLCDTRRSYDVDASGYAAQVDGLLAGNPYLRGCLDLFAALVRDAGGGAVLDVGCGTGYVTGYLHDAGLEASGLDLSSEMVAIARRDHPHLRFEIGTMTDLALTDGAAAGIVAFWSVIHVPDHAMPGVCREFFRVLRPGGAALIGFHVGDGTRRTTEGYTGRPVALDSHRRRPDTVARWLRDAGFDIEAEVVTRPDDAVPGALLFARSPAR